MSGVTVSGVVDSGVTVSGVVVLGVVDSGVTDCGVTFSGVTVSGGTVVGVVESVGIFSGGFVCAHRPVQRGQSAADGMRSPVDGLTVVCLARRS